MTLIFLKKDLSFYSVAYAAIVLGYEIGKKMTSVGLDLCLGVADLSLKQEIYLVILFSTFSAVNALRVPSITSQKSTQRKH